MTMTMMVVVVMVIMTQYETMVEALHWKRLSESIPRGEFISG